MPDLAMRSEIEGRAKHRVQSSWHLQMRRHYKRSNSVVKIFSYTPDTVRLRYTITVASRDKWKMISIHISAAWIPDDNRKICYHYQHQRTEGVGSTDVMFIGGCLLTFLSTHRQRFVLEFRNIPTSVKESIRIIMKIIQ